LDSLDTVLGIALAGRWEREINDTHLLTGQLQVFDDLPEGDDLVSEEIDEFLVGFSRGSQDQDVPDPGRVRVAGLCDVSVSVKRMENRGITDLVALEGRSTPRTEASPISGVQYFTEDRDDKIVVVVIGAEELGHKVVRRPGVSLPMCQGSSQ